IVDAGGVLRGGIGNLIEVAAIGADEAELIFGIGIEDERGEAAQAVVGVMQHLGGRRLETQARAVAAEAAVIGEAIGVAAEIDLVVGLIEAPCPNHNFGFPI